MYEPSQIGVPPTEAKTLSDIGNWPYYIRFSGKCQAIIHKSQDKGNLALVGGHKILDFFY